MSETNNDGWREELEREIEKLDFTNVEQIAKNAWLFLTNDSMPNVAIRMKKEAFLHEVRAALQSMKSKYEQLLSSKDERIKEADARATSWQQKHEMLLASLSSKEEEIKELKKIVGQAEVQSSEPVASPSCTSGNAIEHEGGYYYDLFKFFSENHDLTLVDTEIQDIISAVEKFNNHPRMLNSEQAPERSIANTLNSSNADGNIKPLCFCEQRNLYPLNCPDCPVALSQSKSSEGMKWVKASERLPEIPPPYYDKDWEGMCEPLCVNVIVYDSVDDIVSIESYWRDGFNNKDVTHWMPLPEPPREQERGVTE